MFFPLLFIFLGSCSAALPICSTTGCPPGGIWSEWSTTSPCSSPCGSCSKQYFTRSCQSTTVNCSCTGSTSRYLPCNTQTCKFPSERTCCIPYLPMLINGSFQCGPLPKDPTGPASCCPSGGLWSDWTGWSNEGSQWIQTRQCVSEGMGCPCTGSPNNTKSGCPCPSMITPANVISTCNLAYHYFPSPSVFVNDSTCTMTATLVANNDVTGQGACSAFSFWKPYEFVSVVSFSAPTYTSNICPQDRPFDCQSRYQPGGNGETQTISFTCDLDALKWRYDALGYLVDGFVQVIAKP